jgi:hypothetical protein
MKATDDATRADLMADRYLASAPGVGFGSGRESAVSALDLDALQALADAATPGPWEIDSQPHGWGPFNVVVREGGVDPAGIIPTRYTPVVNCAAASGPKDPRTIEANRRYKSAENAAFVAAAREAVPDLIAECRELRERLGAALVSEQRAKEMALSQGDAQVRMALEWTNMERRAERAERAEAEVARLKVFVSRHTDGSCTNPLCDCVEAKLHRAQATIERVRAVEADVVLDGRNQDWRVYDADEIDAALEERP